MGRSGNEQFIMTSIIRDKTINVTVNWLDPQLFTPGKYYERINLSLKLPMVVLNNWIIGNAAKIARAKKWKHWYLDDNGRNGDVVGYDPAEFLFDLDINGNPIR